jgi:hypothetical protein
MRTLAASFSYKGHFVEIVEDRKAFTAEITCLRYGIVLIYPLGSATVEDAVRSAKQIINKPPLSSPMEMRKLSEEQVRQKFEQLGFTVTLPEILSQLEELQELHAEEDPNG